MNRPLRGIAATSLAAGILLTAASFRPVDAPTTAAPEAPTGVDRIYAPFDTLETDLNDYRWPLPDGFLTTSVFGDFRASHFHGGIDVSTQGREGIPVRAMRSGWVSLVRISPHGYGNVVEVTHADGFTTWYAHLRGFSPLLDSLVRPLLRASGGVAAQVRPDSGVISVESDDVIAFSGSTGAGGPHFHFEIRDAQRNPVDPMLVPAFNDRVVDRIPPTFEELGVVPLAAGTLVQGNIRPVYLRPGRSRAGVAGIDRRLHLTGDVGLTVRVRDAVGPRQFRNRNTTLELFVDGTSVFSSHAARVPFNDSKQIALHYDWTAKAAGHPYHQKLFVEEGNRLPFYARAPHGTGILRTTDFAEGAHTLEIVARDLNGNESRLRADVVFNHPPAISVERSGDRLVVAPTSAVAVERLLIGTSDDGVHVSPWRSMPVAALDGRDGRWHLPHLPASPFIQVAAVNAFGTASDPVWIATGPARAASLDVSTEIVRNMAIVTIRSSQPLNAPPRVRVRAAQDLPEPGVRSASSRQYVASFQLRPDLGRRLTVEATADGPKGSTLRGEQELTLFAVTPSDGGAAEWPDGSFRLSFGPRGVLSDTYVRLEPIAGGIQATPGDRLLDEGADVEMDVPGQLLHRKVGLFARNDVDDLMLAWRPAFGERRLRGHINRFLGTFRVLEDEVPPRFDRAYLSYRSGTLLLELRIRDDRSGLATSTIRVTVDGEPVPAVFDADRRRLTVQEPMVLSSGRHRVEVRARDRMENEGIWVGSVSKR